jgi:endonuclease-3 related protein
VLLAAFGPQHWWPAPPGRETPLAVMVGAVLTQNTNWRNVERAMANLNAAGVLASEILSRLSEEELARLVQPSGFYRVKARRLKALMDWLMATAGGDMVRLRRRPLAGEGGAARVRGAAADGARYQGPRARAPRSLPGGI